MMSYSKYERIFIGDPTSMIEASKQFESIFRNHHKLLCDFAFNFVRDKDAAKDIVQDVFLKLWKNIDNVEVSDRIGNYLFKATAHTALNHLRGNERMFRINDNSDLDRSMALSQDTNGTEFSELEVLVERAIDRLPPRCKVIYLLSRHEGLKNRKIAETLGLSVKTVENQMTIALEKLRNEILPYIKHEIILIFGMIGALLVK